MSFSCQQEKDEKNRRGFTSDTTSATDNHIHTTKRCCSVRKLTQATIQTKFMPIYTLSSFRYNFQLISTHFAPQNVGQRRAVSSID